MPLYEGRRPKSNKMGPFFGVILVGAFIAGLIYLFLNFDIRGDAPQINLIENYSGAKIDLAQPIHFGKTPQWSIFVSNTKGGICGVDFSIAQNQSQLVLVDHRVEKNKQTQLNLEIKDKNLIAAGFQEGALTGKLSAYNCALIKRKTEIQLTGDLDLTPPRLALTSTQHYINQGGADVASYTVSPDAVWSGLKIGPYRFQGYPKPGTISNEHFVFFVYSYEFGPGQPLELVAYDQAGNESKATLSPSKFFPKEFRKRELPISDDFITTKVVDIMSNTQIKRKGDALQDFLAVNSDLRKKNTQFLVDISKKSEPVFFWKDAFKPLMNASIEASFADYRSYMYQGQKVDEQVHLGFDMAAVEHYPVNAGNRGKILFADYLGIYGNTVLIDHGYGIVTLYGHLSSIDVKVGDMVEKDQKIANSGATGLAGGDHLHFSLLIQGVQTNPVEFWDQHWIDDHVYLRVGKEAFGKD